MQNPKLVFVALALIGCGSAPGSNVTTDPTTPDPATLDSTEVTGGSARSAPPVTASLPPVESTDPAPPGAPPSSDPGAKPSATCSIAKDANGFFARAGYVGYAPPTYDGTKPFRLLVGLHGCGDDAYNFATWAIAPWDTRKTQDHIAVSVGGRDGQCWSNADEPKVMAAIADIASCFWVHQKKVVVAGFSSGGELAYRVGMKHADSVAGLLILDSGFYGSSDEAALLASASRKLPIAHRAHQGDTVFPLATVQSDWAKIKAAGFPLQTTIGPGGHDGTSDDWNGYLLPQMGAWSTP